MNVRHNKIGRTTSRDRRVSQAHSATIGEINGTAPGISAGQGAGVGGPNDLGVEQTSTESTMRSVADIDLADIPYSHSVVTVTAAARSPPGGASSKVSVGALSAGRWGSGSSRTWFLRRDARGRFRRSASGSTTARHQ
jgi:hypothetical protein